MSKFSIFQGRDGQYYWRLKASNGETLCHSEGYTAKQSAQRGVESCKLMLYRYMAEGFNIFVTSDTGQIYELEWNMNLLGLDLIITDVEDDQGNRVEIAIEDEQ